MTSMKYSCPTVFLGGGTPGLFTSEYQILLNLLSPVLTQNPEISLEANPNNVSESSLLAWKESGFTRLSLGVQSFREENLKFLSRDHSSADATESIKLARKWFPNLNIDLIYGLPDQTLESWTTDLEMAVDLEIRHLSLYNLTWEPQTTLGRRKLRNKITPLSDEKEFALYEQARSFLAKHEFHHEEVSNWSKTDSSCRHNWVYWRGEHFIGIGSGAHGFLPTESSVGLRYSYPKNDRLMEKLKLELKEDLPQSLQNSGLILDSERALEELLLETIGASLRTNQGVPVTRLENTCQREFLLHPDLKNLEALGELFFSKGYLKIDPKHWFMENFWARRVIQSFK